MIYVVLGLIGAAMGSVYLYGRGDFLLGGAIGLLAAAAINLRNRLVALEKRLAAVEGRTAERFSASDEPAAASESAPPEAAAADEPLPAAASVAADPGMPSLELELADEAAAASDVPPFSPPPSAAYSAGDTRGAGAVIREFLFGGNLMVRVGVVVLLFGFAFLVKYAAARNLVPLEVRLAAAFAAGIGLLLLGWRLRRKRFGYAVSLQGGGIGVMYLTLFAAARLFQMVPLPLTFAVMVGLVAFSGVLAVLQNAAVLAVLGAAGGFLAPVLLSTGSGSHVMLFSYYALLNAGIFGVAWFRAWRWLNLLGFVFTFGIGSAWGIEYYQPAHFASTEPFLILFFAFYLVIAILFALRQPPRLKGLVDGTLVFAMPLVVFGLQVGLVADFPYGLAFSAVALGLIYTTAATLLWRQVQGVAALAEAFLALGVIFGSLAIPLALSGSWTAVAWSLEGAGLVWIGLRQHRWTARAFGILLQLGSGALFLFHGGGTAAGWAMLNPRFLGGMMVSLAGLISAYFLERHHGRLHRLERPLPLLALAWGMVWWFGIGLDEIDRHLPRRHELAGAMAYTAVSGLAMAAFFRRLKWNGLRWPALGVLPAMVLAAGGICIHYYLKHPFQGWWLAVWPLAVFTHFHLLRGMESAWPRTFALYWHLFGALLIVTLISWEAGWLLDRLAGGAAVWGTVAWGVVPALALMLLVRRRAASVWPLVQWRAVYCQWLPLPLAAGLLVWSLRGLFLDGDPRPLPYLPLFNPLDLVQAGVYLTLFHWLADAAHDRSSPVGRWAPGVSWGVPAVGVLFWLTAVVARTVHHLAGVRYDWAVMFHSDLFHAAVAVLWGTAALACMVAASRTRRRPVWFAGAVLLALVVVKLFVVDLSGSGTVSRIVSFLAVGGLMLVIGFLTPLPPAQSKGASG